MMNRNEKQEALKPRERIMPRRDYYGSCPKCGALFGPGYATPKLRHVILRRTVVYDVAPFSMPVGEALRRECLNCKYIWHEPVVEEEGKPNAEP